jgi:hypothetical protein
VSAYAQEFYYFEEPVVSVTLTIEKHLRVLEQHIAEAEMILRAWYYSLNNRSRQWTVPLGLRL